MYKAIIFDLGNVLIEVSSKRAHEYWGKLTRLEPDELAKLFPVDHVFKGFERGEIEPVVFREYVMNRLGIKIPASEFDEGWNRILMEPLPDMKEILTQLRKNYRLAGLSNTNKIHADYWKIKYAGYLADLEHIFSSHEIKALKPEPKAYQTVLEYLGLKPEEVIFIDDLPANVAGAERLGIKGLVMKSPKQLVLELRALRINIDLPGNNEA